MNRIVIKHNGEYGVEDIFFYVVSAYREVSGIKDKSFNIVKKFNDELGTVVIVKKVWNDYWFEVSGGSKVSKLLKEKENEEEKTNK